MAFGAEGFSRPQSCVEVNRTVQIQYRFKHSLDQYYNEYIFLKIVKIVSTLCRENYYDIYSDEKKAFIVSDKRTVTQLC